MKDRDVGVGRPEAHDLSPQSSGDAPFTARMRLHQSWYRATVLQVPCGTGPQLSSRSQYGNMLDAAAAAAGLNFLTPEVFAIARARIAQGPGVEPFRCLHNMLSSQPMCFNLFGPLVADLDLATRCMRALLPNEVDRVTEVRIEFAPAPADEYLGDRTSFDAFVVYTRLDGTTAFLGIETKLTESFSPGEYQKQSYRRLTECDGSLWRPEAWATMSKSEWNQLWRNHLLVEAMCRHPRPQHGTRGRSVLIRHPGDSGVAVVVEQYRSFLAAPDDTFADWPLDRVVDAFAGACVEEQEAIWIERFRLRYLDLAA
jgi:PD-(D/E)XK nuclease superfamily